MTLRVEMRAAVVDLLEGYNASLAVPLKLQVYPARPRTLHPPSAFIDLIREVRVPYGDSSGGSAQVTIQAEVILLHGPQEPGGGSFDSADSAGQADRLVDGFVAWVDTHVHAIGANTTIGAVAVEDDPTYQPDWIPNTASIYYSTRVTLEGFAANLTI